MKTNNVLHAIAALNLDPIKNKLMDAEHGEGWSRAKVDAMDLEYRRFLHLMHTFPNESASPTKAVDTFWHYHILDTQKYAADCDAIFGCFMHHNPYGNEASETSGVAGGDRMQELYEATFDQAYIRPEAYYLGGAVVGTGDGRQMKERQSGAQKAVCATHCHAFCMMQAKPASTKTAVCATHCHAFCMMQAKPEEAEAVVSEALRTRPKQPVDASARCA